MSIKFSTYNINYDYYGFRDALAVSLMELKNFKQEDFALTHPGGSLGRRLLSSVKDEMKQNNLPFIDQNS